ncbi:MAG: MBL fold metallo-hydrolase [Clostridiales Family XIII bacterium]|jgi:glyoxylase-like metal-dependent hydrolase (beta-lactamase superfamily II)|nr:MBL fold metallo-hydrolase [Clostridiales Family XIII bacterium]
MGYFKTHKIDADTYYITEPLGVGAYLFLGNDRALLSDTGYGYMDIGKPVARITDMPPIVMNTHGHADHAGGDTRFKEIYIHPADAPLLDPNRQKEQRDLLFGYAKKVYPFLTPILFFLELRRTEKYKPVVKALDDGHLFDLGGRVLESIHFPGHTPGSVILADRRTKTLYAGDAVNHGLFLFFPDSPTLREYAAALRKLARLQGFERIRVSHGLTEFPFGFIEYYADFLERATLEKSERTDIPNGATPVLKYTEPGEAYGVSEISALFTEGSLAG